MNLGPSMGSNAHYWPQGWVLREKKGPDDFEWNENKWVWSSNGFSNRKGCKAIGAVDHIQCDAAVYIYEAQRDGQRFKVWEHSDPRAARNAVEKSKARLGLTSGGSKGGRAVLRELGGLNNKLGMRFIIESSFSGPTYFTLESPFMLDVIRDSVQDWIVQDDSGSDAGRHGFCTDGDHSFFAGTGTLLATCAFSTVIQQWVPVLYTWIDALDTDHHRPHFRRLNKHILDVSGEQFDPKYLTTIMDFSQAQRSAHAEEFVDAVISRIAGWDWLSAAAQKLERARFLEDASKYQQGCRVHFQRSVMRIKKDKAIVPAHLQDTFETSINTLLDTTSAEVFTMTMQRLRTDFPTVLQGRISWWEQDHIAAMIFPALQQGPDVEFRHSEIPQTSNPIETQHSLLHHATGKSHQIPQGIKALSQYDAAKGTHLSTPYFSIGPLQSFCTSVSLDSAPIHEIQRKRWALAIETCWDIVTPSNGYGSSLTWITLAIQEMDDEQVSSMFGVQHEALAVCSSGHISYPSHSPIVTRFALTNRDTKVMNILRSEVLMVVPETRNDTAAAYASKSAHSVTFPLHFSLSTASPLSVGQSSSSIGSFTSNSSLVDYQIVGRVLFHPKRGHYTAQVVLGNMTYDYDSMQGDGLLHHVGSATMVTTPTRCTGIVFYHRNSGEQTTFRTMSSIQASINAYNRNPIGPLDGGEVSDSDDLPSVHKLLQEPHTSRRPSHDTVQEFIEEAVNDPDTNGMRLLHSREPSDTSMSSIDDPRDGRMVVGCSRCEKWSHKDCIEEQFGLPDNIDDPKVLWLCPYCSNAPMWDNSMIIEIEEAQPERRGLQQVHSLRAETTHQDVDSCP
ncbi:hypothetical protein BD310DRAFT_995754 [Dichomitus squalens]|uniref:PHD-type domain-containing protein n=1 Tax=Dichomitus squalens TaxID=114155 RepID=A0A4Q9PF71_9APHY|nr:hypothetical protein BD310DRAFT_995754 [Dichomitus squalens]